MLRGPQPPANRIDNSRASSPPARHRRPTLIRPTATLVYADAMNSPEVSGGAPDRAIRTRSTAAAGLRGETQIADFPSQPATASTTSSPSQDAVLAGRFAGRSWWCRWRSQ
jgi:hypothetical protein